MNIMASSSSPRMLVGAGNVSAVALSISPSLPRRIASRRRRSSARFLATWKSQPRGSAGTPLNGQIESARTSASCTASSARSSRAAPSQRASRATIWPALWRKRCSTSASTPDVTPPSTPAARVLDLAHLDAAGAFEMRVGRQDLEHLVVATGLDEPEAAHDLLGLDVRPVGHGHLARIAAEHASLTEAKLLRAQHTASLAEIVAPRHVLLDRLLHLLRAQPAGRP